VELHPKIVHSGARQPTQADLDWLHDKAHRERFIASSVTTEVSVVEFCRFATGKDRASNLIDMLDYATSQAALRACIGGFLNEPT